MKKTNTLKIFLVLSILFCYVNTMNAQIRLVEVNPTTDTVKVHNYGGSTVDISSYWFCSLFSYIQLNNGGLTVTGSLNLAAGADVTISGFGLNDSDADLGLYINNSFSSFSSMLDFIQWGDAGNGRESVAANSMLDIWDAGTFLSGDGPYTYTGDGSGTDVKLAFWSNALSNEDFVINNFSMSPNPTSSMLSLKFPQIIDNGTLHIYNALGETIFNKTLSFNNFLEIDVSNFNQGLYLVKINNQTKRFVKR